MKHLLFLLFPLISIAQKSEVIIDSAETKAQIFAKSLAWVAKTWNSANDVVQMKDQESGTIIVKGGLQSVPRNLGVPGKGITMTEVTIICKDGKSKISFDNASFKWLDGTLWTTNSEKRGQQEKWRNNVYKEQQSLIDSYKVAVYKKQDDF